MRRKKYDCEKIQLCASGAGVPPLELALLKLKKGKRGKWVALATQFGSRDVNLNVPC